MNNQTNKQTAFIENKHNEVQICANHQVTYYITYKVLRYDIRITQKTLKPTYKPFWFLRQSLQRAVNFKLQKNILNKQIVKQ